MSRRTLAAAFTLLLLGSSRPGAAQRIHHLDAPEAAAARTSAPAPAPGHSSTATPAERGDFKLMFGGGLLGGTLGYLVGWGTATGVASAIERQGRDAEPFVPYLLALPSLASAAGAVTGASKGGCSRLAFGSLYALSSCADARVMLLGALPGAVLQYFLPRDDVGALAASVVAEAAGAALAGSLARRSRAERPAW